MQKDAQSCFPKPPTKPTPVTCAEVHTVVAGDTLYTLSYKYNVSVPLLMQVNKILNPYNLRIGQRICIPEQNGSGPVTACNGSYYTVAAGDTLYLIAKKFNITLDALLKANSKLDPYNLGIGMRLCIPEMNHEIMDGTGNDNMLIPPNMPETPDNGNNMGGRCPGGMIYNTQKGDTLSRILDRFDVSYADLKKANPGVDFSGSLETLALCIPM